MAVGDLAFYYTLYLWVTMVLAKDVSMCSSNNLNITAIIFHYIAVLCSQLTQLFEIVLFKILNNIVENILHNKLSDLLVNFCCLKWHIFNNLFKHPF